VNVCCKVLNLARLEKLLHAPEWNLFFRSLYSSTALLLLVNPHIPHWNNGTANPTYAFFVWRFVASYVQPNIQQYDTNQQLFKKNFCNQITHYENYRWFPLGIKATTNSTLFMMSKDEWENALYVQRHGKRHLSGWSDIKQRKIKPIALAIVKLWVWRHQAVSQKIP